MSVKLLKQDSEVYDDLRVRFKTDYDAYLEKRNKSKLIQGSIIYAIIIGLFVLLSLKDISYIALLIGFALGYLSFIVIIIIREYVPFSKQYGYILVTNSWDLSKSEDSILSDQGVSTQKSYMLEIDNKYMLITKEQYKALKELPLRSIIMVDMRNEVYK